MQIPTGPQQSQGPSVLNAVAQRNANREQFLAQQQMDQQTLAQRQAEFQFEQQQAMAERQMARQKMELDMNQENVKLASKHGKMFKYEPGAGGVGGKYVPIDAGMGDQSSSRLQLIESVWPGYSQSNPDQANILASSDLTDYQLTNYIKESQQKETDKRSRLDAIDQMFSGQLTDPQMVIVASLAKAGKSVDEIAKYVKEDKESSQKEQAIEWLSTPEGRPPEALNWAKLILGMKPGATEDEVNQKVTIESIKKRVADTEDIKKLERERDAIAADIKQTMSIITFKAGSKDATGVDTKSGRYLFEDSEPLYMALDQQRKNYADIDKKYRETLEKKVKEYEAANRALKEKRNEHSDRLISEAVPMLMSHILSGGLTFLTGGIPSLLLQKSGGPEDKFVDKYNGAAAQIGPLADQAQRIAQKSRSKRRSGYMSVGGGPRVYLDGSGQQKPEAGMGTTDPELDTEGQRPFPEDMSVAQATGPETAGVQTEVGLSDEGKGPVNLTDFGRALDIANRLDDDRILEFADSFRNSDDPTAKAILDELVATGRIDETRTEPEGISVPQPTEPQGVPVPKPTESEPEYGEMVNDFLLREMKNEKGGKNVSGTTMVRQKQLDDVWSLSDQGSVEQSKLRDAMIERGIVPSSLPKWVVDGQRPPENESDVERVNLGTYEAREYNPSTGKKEPWTSIRLGEDEHGGPVLVSAPQLASLVTTVAGFKGTNFTSDQMELISTLQDRLGDIVDVLRDTRQLDDFMAEFKKAGGFKQLKSLTYRYPTRRSFSKLYNAVKELK